MRIAVLGTSNSVVGARGYVAALRLRHDVVNLSIGRAPFYSHIRTMLDHWKALEARDLVIVDHYVNDVHFYGEALGEDYLAHRKEFYDLLSTLNTRVLNLLFPIRAAKREAWRQDVRALSEARGIPCLDLNEIPFERHHFADDLHLAADVSYLFGLRLSQDLSPETLGPKPEGGRAEGIPFRLVRGERLVGAAAMKTFANSLLSARYFDLDAPLRIEVPDSHEMVALSYLRPKHETRASGLALNGVLRGLGDRGFFTEAVDVPLAGPVTLEPLPQGVAACPNLMARGLSEAPFGVCHLADFLFRDQGARLACRAAARPPFRLDLSDLGEIAGRMCPTPPQVSRITVDVLRDTALRVEGWNLASACEIMELARAARPDGPLITAKLREYRARLGQ